MSNSYEKGGPVTQKKNQGTQVAKGLQITPTEREFIRRVCHNKTDPEKAMISLDTGPGPKPSLSDMVRPEVLRALLNEYAVMEVRLAQSNSKWKELISKAKKTLSEIMIDTKATAAARVNACKAIFDVLKVVDPMLLKEQDMGQDLEDAVNAIVDPTPVSKAVN